MQVFDRNGAGVGNGWAGRWLPPLLLLAVGFCLVPLAHTCQLACVPGNVGDARFNGFMLEHFYRWILGKDPSLLSPPFFYPMPGASTFSDNHWGTAWIYSAYRALGWDHYQSFDLWYLTGYLLNFVVAHVVFRRLRFSPLASAVGAFAFTFAMPVVARYGHAQLTYRLFIPIGLLIWQRFVEGARWRWIALLACAVVGQFYISIYLGYFMLLLLASWALAQWWIEGIGPRAWFAQWNHWREPAVRRELVLSIAIVALAALAFVLLLYPYMHYSRVYGFSRSLVEIASMLPRPQSYLVADASTIWKPLSIEIGQSLPMRHEQQLFFGLGILGLATMGVLRSMRRARWVALASIGLLVLLTLSVDGHSMYLLAAKLPGMGAVRAVARIGQVLVLPLALLVVLGVEALWRDGLGGRVFALLLVAILVCESSTVTITNFNSAEEELRITALQRELPRSLPADAVIFNPLRPETPFFVSEIDGMLLGRRVERPTLNGYSGNIPPGYEPRADESVCDQALYRIQAAKRIGAPGAATLGDVRGRNNIVVLDHSVCTYSPLLPFPAADARKLELQIVSVQKAADVYTIHIRIRNGSDVGLNTSGSLPAPLRLSWQVLSSGASPDPSAWRARVELPGVGALQPGGMRDVSFTIPAGPNEGREVAVSAVLEGRLWLHDHGLAVQTAELVKDGR
ncbi:hypothetical protein [Xanthomonas bonasiae]|uniref:hypothetical protein n=1 Tax=Xanthomonas bonasiae TaxID=2810351 RepID=UPI00197FEEFE|nr:hypothetical protein [Xanthomonas bonasiae]MBN6109998.1 hypothetical protein [Xanthomonas bonasiae]